MHAAFRVFAAAAILLGIAPSADACSVPVFRYALERWRSSPYEVLVYHRGKLPPQARKQFDALNKIGLTTNIDITDIDLDKNPEPALRKLWKAAGTNLTLPAVLVRYPNSEEQTPLFWSGPLADLDPNTLFDSPLRRHMIDLLGRGETALLLLLKGDDPEENARVLDLLDQQRVRLEKEIKLPDQSEEGPQIELRIPIRVSFAILELDRDDPGERELIRMLLQSETELGRTNGAIVFPIFGRARVLCGLHGDQLNDAELEHALRFLCGRCSCQVKELNPGMDLLATTDWEKILDGKAIDSAPPPPAKPSAPPESEKRTWAWMALAGALILALLSGIWMIFSRRNPK